MSIVETERLIVREWTLDDVDAAFAIFGDPEVTRYLPAGALKASREEMTATLHRVVGEYPQIRPMGFWAVVERASHLVVGASLLRPLPDDPRIEIGWHLARTHWGRGYASEAAGGVLAWAQSQLHVPDPVAVIVPGNTRSEAVAARLGMSPGERELLFGLDVRVWTV